jgi:hypothetical protein
MKWLFLLVLAVPVAMLAQDEDPLEATNVNSRYTVEKISISGLPMITISSPLRTEMNHIVGEKLDQSRLQKLAAKMKQELHAADVTVNVSKGTQPDHVQVNFEVKARQQGFDMNVAKFLYDSKEGWTGAGTATTRIDGNAFTFGLVSDGDVQLERYTGITAKYSRDHIGPHWANRVGLRFEFDGFHNQWDPATQLAAGNAPAAEGIYRDRQTFSPEARIYLAEPVELDFGVRFARYRMSTPGANTESSNAVVSTLRYHQRWGSDPDVPEQELDASYSFEDATHFLESDPDYSRHLSQVHYQLRHARSVVKVCFLAGRIAGQAPLFDRFVLGNASTLRGWNKFDLDPLGGSRMVHGSIDYDYRFFQIFYDTGAVWDRVQDREQKQSLGAGFKKAPFQLAVAFPVRAGRADPVFFAGMNF